LKLATHLLEFGQRLVAAFGRGLRAEQREVPVVEVEQRFLKRLDLLGRDIVEEAVGRRRRR